MAEGVEGTGGSGPDKKATAVAPKGPSSENRSPVDVVGGGIADGEVRPVPPPAQLHHSRGPVLLFLLLLLLIGAVVWFGLRSIPLSEPEPSASKPAVQSQAAMHIPIDRPVEEVVLEPPPEVAAKKLVTMQPPSAPASIDAGPVVAQTESEQGGPDAAIEEKNLPAPAPEPTPSPFAVLVGPYLSSSSLEEAAADLKQRGYTTETTRGKGPVEMIRLLEGVYPVDDGHKRLSLVQKKAKSAFVLPVEGKLALYVGSFADRGRADQLSAELEKKGVHVTPVIAEVEMDGKMLAIPEQDQQVAQTLAGQLENSGYTTRVISR